MNIIMDLKVEKRGHYPKGSGKVSAKITPVKYLSSFVPKDYNEINYIKGISHCVRLPKHVAIKQKDSANKILRRNNYPQANIKVEYYHTQNGPI